MTRDPESFVLEIDYWREILSELRELHDRVGNVADELASAIVRVIPLAAIVYGTAGQNDLGTITTGLGNAMNEVRALQSNALEIGRLIDGRLHTLALERQSLEEEPS